ncbi:MAG: hypothetical protein KTR15_13370 [Phycisphaeraceae bacterium]|nr:hypothetical protein [Phycisphaeraceae bacterium]
MNVSTASAIQQAQVQTEVSYAVARKQLDSTKAQGDAALSLLQSAAEIQQNAQQQAQRPLGPGQTISVVA